MHLSRHAADADPEFLFDETLAALRSEYHEIEVEPADDVLEHQALKGFDVSFLCLDLTNTCWLRTCQGPRGTFLWMCQAEDREFEQVAPVFRAMIASALRSLESPG